MYVSWCDADDDDGNEKTLYVLVKCFLMLIQVFYLISSSSLISCRYRQTWNFNCDRSVFALLLQPVCVKQPKSFQMSIFSFSSNHFMCAIAKESTCSRHDDDNFDWILTRADVNNSLLPARITHKKLYLLRKLFHFSHTRYRINQNKDMLTERKKTGRKPSVSKKTRIKWTSRRNWTWKSQRITILYNELYRELIYLLIKLLCFVGEFGCVVGSVWVKRKSISLIFFSFSFNTGYWMLFFVLTYSKLVCLSPKQDSW